MKTLVRVSNTIYLLDKDNNNYILPISNSMQYLTYGGHEYYFPFVKGARSCYEYEQSVKMTFSYPLITTSFLFEDKLPSTIKKLFNERKILMAEIDSFELPFCTICRSSTIKKHGRGENCRRNFFYAIRKRQPLIYFRHGVGRVTVQCLAINRTAKGLL